MPGYCYVGAVKQDDRTFVAALLGCGWPNNKTYKWSDMKKLMEFAFSNYHYMDIAEPDVRLETVCVKNGADPSFQLKPDMELQALMESRPVCVLKADWEKTEVIYDYPRSLNAPVQKGEILGQAEYYLEGECVDEIPVTAGKTVESRDFLWFFTFVWKRYRL